MDGLFRLIDANANRAREGLRVVEDVARFVLDDAVACARMKEIRHELKRALDSVDPGGARLVGARDVEGDAGRVIEGAGEYARADVVALIGANAKRAEEGLRAIEEACKSVGDESAAKAVERGRYAVYEVEQRLVRSASARTRAEWALCVIVTRTLCARMDWKDVIRASAAGGAACFQLREKGLTSRELAGLAREFVGVCHSVGACAIVNDRADIALMSGADGVHVGVDDPPIGEVVRAFGDRLIVGASAPSGAHAREAIEARAHYLGVGAMFETNTKVKDGIRGTGFLREVMGMEGCPHVLAIGGISGANVHEVVDAGGRGVAVSSAVCGAGDPGAVCAGMLSLLQQPERAHAER